MPKRVCLLCKHKYEPLLEVQKYCSATCCKAAKDTDELSRVYEFLDGRLMRAGVVNG